MPTWSDLVQAARAAPIPAPNLRAVTLAQWALESGWGTSALARVHGNFAGLKWRSEMAGFATKVSYAAHDGVDDYCAFASVEAFIRGYWRFIERPPYEGWAAFKDDPAGYLAFLRERGYAADPAYVGKVLAILPKAAEQLGAAAGEIGGGPMEEPDRPSHAEIGESVADLLAAGDEPDFVTLGHVRHKFLGPRPGGLEGAIVHYDASRTRPTKGADDPEWGAKTVLAYAQGQGYAYATISRSGRIYLPGNMDWESWGHHAGISKCPATGRTSVSQFYVGFEINSPGYVYPTANPNAFVPWFDAARDENGRVILDANGHATIKNPKGELYKKADLRHFTAAQGNIRPGSYVPYTDVQYTALVAAMLYLKRTYKKTFRLERVFGHDEVSPGRKVDPGGSLGPKGNPQPGPAVTMAQFRAELLKAWADQQALVA